MRNRVVEFLCLLTFVFAALFGFELAVEPLVHAFHGGLF